MQEGDGCLFLSVPGYVRAVLEMLEHGGWQAYLVGGCVRDALLGREPNDWDVTTDALPEEIQCIFAGFPVIRTGEKHGTVTVLSEGMPVEVTTYRIDGTYTDRRHPDSVQFTRRLSDDLARRDFTVNALAYNQENGLIDYFGGQNDLKNGILRCVGEPGLRFQEDSLRILRLLRFSSQLGFQIERCTTESALRNRKFLGNISQERVRDEFVKLLCGKNAANVLREYREIIAVFVPEIRPAFGFEQHNPHHIYDVWEHTLHCISAAEPQPVVRLSMFLHDLGKPECFTLDSGGVGHFHGHPVKSALLAGKILTRLRFDRKTAETVILLVRSHSLPLLPEEHCLRRRLNQLGDENLRLLIKVQEADAKGKASSSAAYLASLEQIPALLDRMEAEGQCFSLKSLAVDGNDLLALGIPRGKEIGRILHALLSNVIDGKIPNIRSALLDTAKKLKGSGTE